MKTTPLKYQNQWSIEQTNEQNSPLLSQSIFELQTLTGLTILYYFDDGDDKNTNDG